LTVVVPAFNEEMAVGKVVTDVIDGLRKWPHRWEILVVDDGSDDQTSEVARIAGAVVLRRPERGGYGASVKAGIRRAHGEWIALLDADGTYDAAMLPALLELLPAYDQVNGARQCDYGRIALIRMWAKKCISKMAEWISGKRIIDLNSGMRVFKRGIALQCLWALPDGFSASTSLTLSFLCDGRLVAYVPVPYRPRIGSSKFHPVTDTVWFLGTILRMILYFKPLRVFLSLAVVIFLVAVPRSLANSVGPKKGVHDGDVSLFCLATLVFVCGLIAELIVAQRRGTGVH